MKATHRDCLWISESDVASVLDMPGAINAILDGPNGSGHNQDGCDVAFRDPEAVSMCCLHSSSKGEEKGGARLRVLTCTAGVG